jgi:D-3-phosphoglycerate dehydrogenase / 2-oxoglutarate reductase
MSKYKIVITDIQHKNFIPEEEVFKSSDYELIIKDCKTEEEIIELTKDADGVIANLVPISKKAIDNMAKCKIISRYGVGYDSVDLEAATANGIIVANVPDYCPEDVSDQAMAMLLSCIRKIIVRSKKVSEGKWNIGEDEKVYRITGKKLGIIGLGRIGRVFLRKMKGFDLSEYLVYDPFISQETADQYGVTLVSLKNLIAESDYISIHSPLNNDTEKMISRKEFSMMKNNAIIINTARGPIIDQEALLDALKSGQINSAGIDVFSHEPIERNSELLALDNIVLSDHHAWYSEESYVELKTKAAMNVKNYLEHKTAPYAVNSIE